MDSDKDFVPTLLLALMLGGFGAHRFYVGRVGSALLMLFTLGGLGIWTLVDVFVIATQNFKDAQGRRIVAAPQRAIGP